jgi:hypothetical protein
MQHVLSRRALSHNRLLRKMTAGHVGLPTPRRFSPLRSPANSCRLRPPALLRQSLGPFPTQLLHTSTDRLKIISRTGSAHGAQLLHAGTDRGKVVGCSRSRHGSSLCVPRLAARETGKLWLMRQARLIWAPRCSTVAGAFHTGFLHAYPLRDLAARPPCENCTATIATASGSV